MKLLCAIFGALALAGGLGCSPCEHNFFLKENVVAVTVTHVSTLPEEASHDHLSGSYSIKRVYQVAGTFPTQYLFDFSGPWAPFNFVELDLQSAAA